MHYTSPEVLVVAGVPDSLVRITTLITACEGRDGGGYVVGWGDTIADAERASEFAIVTLEDLMYDQLTDIERDAFNGLDIIACETEVFN